MAIYRIEQCKREAGYKSNASIYGMVRAGVWTKPVKLSERSTGWPDYEVQALCRARIAGLAEAEIKTLVDTLHKQRAWDAAAITKEAAPAVRSASMGHGHLLVEAQ